MSGFAIQARRIAEHMVDKAVGNPTHVGRMSSYRSALLAPNFWRIPSFPGLPDANGNDSSSFFVESYYSKVGGPDTAP